MIRTARGHVSIESIRHYRGRRSFSSMNFQDDPTARPEVEVFMRENRVFLRKGKHPLLNFTTSRPRTIMCSSPHATFAFVQAEATSRQFRVWRGSTRDTSVAQRLAKGRLYHIRFRSHRIVSVYRRVASVEGRPRRTFFSF